MAMWRRRITLAPTPGWAVVASASVTCGTARLTIDRHAFA